MKFIKKYVKNLDWEKLSDFSFYSLLIIYVICAMSFGAYLNNGIIKPTLTSLLLLPEYEYSLKFLHK